MLLCYDYFMNKKGFVNITLIVLVVVLAGTAGYFSLYKPTAEQKVDVDDKALLKEWNEVAKQIRAMEGGQDKSNLLDTYRFAYFRGPNPKAANPVLIKAIIESVPDEVDGPFLAQNRAELTNIIDASGVEYLIKLISKNIDDPIKSKRLTQIYSEITSPDAMPVLQKIARDKKNFILKEDGTVRADDKTERKKITILFGALESLIRSGREEDIRAFYDRFDISSEREFPGMVTMAVETKNPKALPFLLDVASGIEKRDNKFARLTAIYTLKNYRDYDPKVKQLLNDLIKSPDNEISSAAKEALNYSR